MDAVGVSAAASSSSIPEKYDVFLSFRGEDTRNNFTSHLFAALKRKQIETYIDEKCLDRGDDIKLALPEAIQKSKISIIIFSKDYASSSWCLRELVHILECRRENKHMVIPIFYDVDPSEIRKQEGSYEKSFLQHEDRFKDNMEMVKRWRAALKESANLSGWDSKVTRPESELVEAIADDVLRKLNRVSSSDIDREGLVGIEKHFKKIEMLLSLGSSDIRIIGIWGLGGIGKTTLADLVFKKHRNKFESFCFLANVREESEKLGLLNLRDKLIGKLLKEESMNLGTPSLPPHVKDRLRRQKVLIVLDDVNDTKQLQVLVGDRDLFGHESRIIVTTRDANVLKDIEADGIYEVCQLNSDEALQLFKLKAFRGNSPTTDYLELSKEVIGYAGGIPLAINILASHLRSLDSQSLGNWEMVLNYLKEDSGGDIDKNLRISYDGLNEKEQAIFLDIACFFKGECRERVENILNGCGFSASIRINNLVNKSLISISYGMLCMHDLVQEMGRKIVQQQSEEQPGQQSRLWIAKDAYRVLSKNEGTQKIEGISLDMAKIEKELHLSPDVFQKMSKLRLLKIYNVQRYKVYLHSDLQFLPHTLRYLHWEGYPSKQLPSNFDPQNLVEMKMPYNQLEKLSNEDQDFDNLKSIDLNHSIRLIQFPDFSHASKLEKINLHSSLSLLQVPSVSLQNLDKLTDLNLSHCNKLQSFPITMTTSLVSLDLSSTAIVSLPSSIDSLKNLSKLSLNNCTRLANLPSNTKKLDSLRYLELGGCSVLEKFPELPWNIKRLDFSGTTIKELASSSIDGRFDLEDIDLSYCRNLESLPTSFFKLRSLARLNLDGCSKLKNLPEVSEPMKHLRFLYLGRTGIRQLPSSIGYLIAIKILNMDQCDNLESVPSSIYNMVSLRSLTLSNCPKLEQYPETTKPMKMSFLDLEGTGIRQLPLSIDFLRCDLRSLCLSGSNIIEVPASIKRFSKLRVLYVNNCKNLRSLPELPLSLKLLYASGCVSLEVVSNSKRPIFPQEFWDGNCIGEGNCEFISFYDFLKLDQKNRNNIMIDFHLRVLRVATQLLPPEPQGRNGFVVKACCPGNEIPKWFDYQRKGSFINIKLPPKWCTNNFLGFVVCAVGDSYSNIEGLDLVCEFDLKANQEENHQFIWSFNNYGADYVNLPTTSNSSHVYMWYKQYWDFYSEFLHVEEVSLDFSFREWDNSVYRQIKSSKCEVKKCGIHMLYRQELEEFMNLRNQHRHGPDQPEPRAHVTNDFDSDEPHLKRFR